jgi:hypothetical protein
MEKHKDVVSVEQYFDDIDEETLIEKADENEYWQKCCEFYQQVKTKNVDFLTEKQFAWLEKIQDQLSS